MLFRSMLLAGFMVAQALIASHELIMYAEQFRYQVLDFSPNLFFIGGFAYAVDGALLYLYANSLIRKDFRVRASHRLHIFPLLGYFVFLVFAYYIQEQSTKSEIINLYLFDLQWHFVTSDTLIKIIRLVYFLLALKDRKSTRLNSSHSQQSRMPSSA